MSSSNNQKMLTERLNAATAKRTKTQVMIKSAQKELDEMFRKAPQRRKDNVVDLEEKIRKLEKQRTIASMPLQEEKEILKEINKMERTKRAVAEYQTHEELAKAKRVELSELRASLKKLGSQISQLRSELALSATAKQLDCSFEELMGMKVPCPKEKIGQVIGKKGGHVKDLQERQKVSVNVTTKDGGAVHILGPLSALESTAAELERLISAKEETLVDQANLATFLCARSITALTELRERHPDVNIAAVLAKKKITLRGVPEDIESAKSDLQSFEIVQEKVSVSAQETSLVIGKQGANVNRIVETHQVAIHVDSKKKKDDKSETIVTLTGPVGNVKMATQDIEELLYNHREETEALPVHPAVKEVLRLNKGEGIRKVFKQTNAELKESLTGRAFVSVSFGTGPLIVVKAQRIVLKQAVVFVEAELKKLENAIVRITIDPLLAPAIIGKNGQEVKHLTEGTRTVNVEVHRGKDYVEVLGMDPAEMETVVAAIQKFLTANLVDKVHCNENEEVFKNMFRVLMRSKVGKEVGELVFLTAVDKDSDIIMRGTEENIPKAKELITEFLAQNYTSKLSLTNEHVSALLRGGKESKITQLSNEFDVNLSTDKERLLLLARGEKAKVTAALEAASAHLSGGDGRSVTKVALDKQSVGLVIGKGASTKSQMETTFDVSIGIRDNCLILRGRAEDTKACHAEITKLLATSRVTEKVPLSGKQRKNIDSRKISNAVPVQIVSSETHLTVRGVRRDVQHAIALLKEQIEGLYESSLELEPAQFQKVKESNITSSHFPRITAATGAEMKMAEKDHAIIFTACSQKMVQAAKKDVLGFIEFFLAPCFGSVEVPSIALATVAQAAVLADVAIQSGACVSIDRDINTLLVASSTPEGVAKAIELAKHNIKNADALVSTIRVGPSEGWILSAMIGKGGKRIRSLRKHTECSIEIDVGAVTLTIKGEDAGVIAKARTLLEGVIEEERGKRVEVDLSSQDMAAFIGRSGSHINEFRKKHNVELQVSRKTSQQSVLLVGELDTVAAAKAALEEWIASRSETEGNNALVELSDEDIPAFIGRKGAHIHEFESNHSVKVDVLKTKSALRLIGEREAVAKAKIALDEWVASRTNGSAGESADVSDNSHVLVEMSEEDIPAFIGRKGAHIQEFREKHNNVTVNVVKGQSPPTVRLTGASEAATTAAEAALKEWIASRAGKSPHQSTPMRSDPGKKEEQPAEVTPSKPTQTASSSKPKQVSKAPSMTNEEGGDFPALPTPPRVINTAASASGPENDAESKLSSDVSTSSPTTAMIAPHSWACVVQKSKQKPGAAPEQVHEEESSRKEAKDESLAKGSFTLTVSEPGWDDATSEVSHHDMECHDSHDMESNDSHDNEMEEEIKALEALEQEIHGEVARGNHLIEQLRDKRTK